MLQVSHSQHRLMIDMLKGRDSWLLAQLCVDHLQPSKRRYIERVEGRDLQGLQGLTATSSDAHITHKPCIKDARAVRKQREVNAGLRTHMTGDRGRFL